MEAGTEKEEEDVESEEVQHVKNGGRGIGGKHVRKASPPFELQEGRTDGADSDCDKDTQMFSYIILENR